MLSTFAFLVFVGGSVLKMAKIDDLKAVLKETLENRGVLSHVRARIRAEVFNALDDQTEPKPSLSNENLLINELIREYLEFNNYMYTNSVLIAETNQPKEKIDRKFLKQELNIEEDADPSSMPLLYGIVSHFLQKKNAPKPESRSALQGAGRKDFQSENQRQDRTENTDKNRLIIYGNNN